MNLDWSFLDPRFSQSAGAVPPPALNAGAPKLPPEARVPANTPELRQGMIPDGSGIRDAFARNAALGAEHPHKKLNIGQFLLSWAGHMGDSLTGRPVYANSLEHQMRMQEEERQAWLKAQMPQQVGDSLIAPDGHGGYRTLFRDPSTPEAYALAQGFTPETSDFANAVKQYRLGSWNDDAVAAKRDLTDLRYNRQGELQDDRQDYGRQMQDDRQAFSDHQLGQRLGVTRRGQDMTDSRVKGSAGYRGKPGKGGRVAAPIRVRSIEEARRLQPGTQFIAPDGSLKVR